MPLVNPESPKQWHVDRVRMRNITDGTSKTIAVTERVITSVEDVFDIVQSNPDEAELSYCGGGATPADTLEEYSLSCRYNQSPDTTYTMPHGKAWISGWTLAANTYLHVRPINGRNCHLYGGEDDGSNLVAPSSRHSGGVVVLLADGSVHFVEETIDQQAWWALGSRNGDDRASLDE